MKTELDWTVFNRDNKDTYPPHSGSYLIYREKCKKMHFRQWNGSWWAYDGDSITHWCDPQTPKKKSRFFWRR